MHKIILLILAQTITCFYEEIENIQTLSTSLTVSKSKLDPEKYYWFEIEDEIWITYFENKPISHNTPFLLFFVVPNAKNEGWPYPEKYSLLLSTFDHFHETSAFISLLPKKQNKNHYRFSITLSRKTVEVEFDLEESSILLSENSVLEELTNYKSYLEHVKFGTKYWNRFYKAEDEFYGLFLETYYVTYLHRIGGACNLRVAGLNLTSLVLLKTELVKGKAILVESSSFSPAVHLQRNVDPQFGNVYRFPVHYPRPAHIEIQFKLKPDYVQEIQVISEDIELKETINEPTIERLRQTGKTIYSFNDIKIEVPVFLFGKRLSLSRLFFVVKLKLARSNEESAKPLTFVGKYYFYNEKASIAMFDVGRPYLVYFTYVIENENIVFQIAKVRDYNNKVYEVNKVATTNSDELTNYSSITGFINGAIIYVENNLVELKGSKAGIKNNKLLVLLFFPLVFIVFFFAILGWLIFCKKKKKFINKK